VNVAVALLALGAGSASSVMQSLGTDGSGSAEKSVHPFAIAPFGLCAFDMGAFDINTAAAALVVVSQTFSTSIVNRWPEQTAQLCLACRSHAKVSWFRLADWLAERSLAWIG
jgi:hypothetical protein